MALTARALLELLAKSWGQLTPSERELFDRWLKGARAEDLYMLMRFARRRWTRQKTSSSQTFRAILDSSED